MAVHLSGGRIKCVERSGATSNFGRARIVGSSVFYRGKGPELLKYILAAK